MDWLFLRLFNAEFSCNVRLLQVFLRGMLTEMRFCSMRVKKLVKVGGDKELRIHPQLMCDQRGCVSCFCCIGRCMF